MSEVESSASVNYIRVRESAANIFCRPTGGRGTFIIREPGEIQANGGKAFYRRAKLKTAININPPPPLIIFNFPFFVI